MIEVVMNSPRHSSFEIENMQSLSNCTYFDSTPNKNRSSPDLSMYLDKIDQSSNRFQKLFKNPNILRLFNSHHPQLLLYLCDRIEDLILLSFDKTDEHLSKFVFYYLLISTDLAIHQALISDDVLKRTSIIALNRKDDLFALTRAIQLLQYTIQSITNEFPYTLSFLCMFLPYINESCVFYFYQSICSCDECYNSVQNWLVEINFPNLLVEELYQIYRKAQFDDENEVQKAINILKLISFCKDSNKFGKMFLKTKLIEVLNDEWHVNKGNLVNDILLNELWITTSIFYSCETAPLMRGLFQKAVELMTEPYCKLDQYRISVIDVISSMLQVDELLQPFIANSHLEETVLRLVIQFPGHSFLQNSLLKLCSTAFEIPIIKDHFARALISSLVFEAANVYNNSILAFTCDLVQAAINAGHTDKLFLNGLKSMLGFDEFMNSILKPRMKLMKNGYGGRLPIFKQKAMVYDLDLVL
ncbi:hypothetical protein TRFO_21848 [Tritrichomonas foetus]|uniref:Uncharacterized protein n=1 Tax=Tritrichomonas foetus TaxID=1144522 RepID=A0A1J4KCY2_9EUKA|nr:hypothetical protein TRFO_21848 [Tritrichomonas foetus]|eukprot:OHT09281.1 hypothetical protein TRFO_21848 [Tritrichomonas foetus]